MLKEIGHIKIKDLDIDRLKRWIEDEVYTLADDFGQKLDVEQGKHIARRLIGVMTGTKVRNWEPITIHNIFQLGITGQYGKTSKVTYQTLINWVWSYDRASRSENKSTGIEDVEYTKDASYYEMTASAWLPFIRWCEDRNIAAHLYTVDELSDLKDRFCEQGPDMMDMEVDRMRRYVPSGNIKI